MDQKNTISLHALGKHWTITLIFLQTIIQKKTFQIKRLRVFLCLISRSNYQINLQTIAEFWNKSRKIILKACNDFCTCSATSIEKRFELFAQNEEIF